MIHRFAALALVLSVAGCSSGGESRPAATAPPLTGTPTTTGEATGTPAPTASASGSAGPVRVAAAGTYPVSVSGSESFGPAGGEVTTRAYPGSSTLSVSGSGARRTVVVRYSPDRDDTVVTDLTGGAVRLVRTDARVAVLAYERTTRFAPVPPVLLLPAGARAGRTFAGRFSGTQPGSYDGRVLRGERLVVGGEAVDTVVVEVRVRFSGDADGSTTTRTWWDPVRLLPVRQRTDATVTAEGAVYEQHATVTLRKLAP